MADDPRQLCPRCNGRGLPQEGPPPYFRCEDCEFPFTDETRAVFLVKLPGRADPLTLPVDVCWQTKAAGGLAVVSYIPGLEPIMVALYELQSAHAAGGRLEVTLVPALPEDRRPVPAVERPAAPRRAEPMPAAARNTKGGGKGAGREDEPIKPQPHEILLAEYSPRAMEQRRAEQEELLARLKEHQGELLAGALENLPNAARASQAARPFVTRHTEGSYSFGCDRPKYVSREEQSLLEAFFREKRTLKTGDLQDCVENVSRVMEQLNTKFPGAVFMSGREQQGYFIDIRPAAG